ALNDLIAGVTSYFFDNLTSSVEFVRAGKLRALAITSKQRNPMVPDLPPISETMPELKPFDVSAWFGAFLPAGTPRPVVDALNAEMKIWLAMPATLERFKTMAGYADYGTPAQYKKFVDSQIALWKGVIDKEGLKLDAN
ncbi:MAG: tripartite tricarboxylate transporter substrate binding protein, partial [Proteobacteria bacterium]|nr:tripartite tricarboxylate transporter substrate binding protein [Pseudomonadota bacterium]